MLYAKEFNKILVFVLWLFALISLAETLMFTYNEIQVVKMWNIPYVIAFIPLLGTIVNIYAVCVMVLIQKKYSGVVVFVLSHVLSIVLSFYFVEKYVGTASIVDLGFYPTLIKISFFLLVLYISKSGISGWGVLNGHIVGEDIENDK